MLTLRLKRQPTVPLEAEVLSVDVLRELKHSELSGLTVYHGKRQLRLDEFFEIEGDGSENITLIGDLSKVRWIGREMTVGSIQIEGNAGMHLGARMKGGQLRVSGDASDWVGAEMRGGTIHVGGNAGGQIGGAYRGGMSGMRNGLVYVEGSAGLEVGLRMRRGTIVVGQTVRDFAGLQMKGGTIVMLGGAEIRTGAWMNRGTIISLKEIPLMPTFSPSGEFNPTFLNVFSRFLESHIGVSLPFASESGRYQRYVGDRAVPGQGEILVWQPNS